MLRGNKSSCSRDLWKCQGFRSRSPLSSTLADWAGFCNSRGSPSSFFSSPSYKDDITFDQWVLLTVSCLGRCKMAVPSVSFTFLIAYMWCFRDRLLSAIWLDAASSSCIPKKIESTWIRIPAQFAKGEERGDRERNPWLTKMWKCLPDKK